mmetsp:Transcript_19934/g.36850  ORF Transcript_19934/g.36850 Transcript_19934/m.36850 type:complete len:83 (-) Transcript_19934:64-312(-)
MKKYVEFVISVGGIYLGFLLAGVVHEQIYSSADAFVYPEFLVLCQFICCYFTTVFIRNLVPSLDQNTRITPKEALEHAFFSQ